MLTIQHKLPTFFTSPLSRSVSITRACMVEQEAVYMWEWTDQSIVNDTNIK